MAAKSNCSPEPAWTGRIDISAPSKPALAEGKGSAYSTTSFGALNADGVPVFSRLQAAMDEGRTDQLLFFAFDLLFLNGQSTAQLPLIERRSWRCCRWATGIYWQSHSKSTTRSSPKSWKPRTKPVSHVYFVETGMVSVVAEALPTHRIECGMVGYEGMTGSCIVLGDDRSPNRSFVQSAARRCASPLTRFAD